MKSLKYILFSTLVLLLVLAGMFMFYNKKEPIIINDYIMSNVDELRKIDISTSADDIKLILEDGFWKVENAENYYANFIVMNHLFEVLKDARYLYITEVDLADTEPMEIVLRDIDDRVLKKIYLFEKESKSYVMADGDIYLISEFFNLPQDIAFWLQQPLVEINYNDIEYINGKKPLTILPIFKVLNFMVFDEVRSSIVLNEEKNTIIIEDDYGIITELKIYKIGDEYWTTKSLSTNKIAKIGARDYVNDNKILYDGWYFRINEFDGKLLYNFRR